MHYLLLIYSDEKAGANLASVAACSICNFFLADRIAFYVEKRA